MRAISLRLLALLCVVVGAAELAVAQDDAAPPTVDPGRMNDRFVIAPGAEPLFAEMLGAGAALPGCRFGNGQIERTYVVATYACDGGPLVLELVHPDVAPPGGVRTERFAVVVKSGAAPEGLLAALAERIRAREDAFTWTNVLETGHSRLLPLVAVGAVVVAMLVFFVFRRLAARRGSA